MKTNVRNTSIETFLQIKREGLLGKRQMEIYNYLYNHGPKNALHVLNALSLPSNQSGRFTELELQGVIMEVDKQPCTITGRPATIWDVTANLPNGVKPQTRAQYKKKLKKEALSLIEGFIKPGMDDEVLQQHRNLYKIIKKL